MRLLLLLPALIMTACTGFPRGWQSAQRATPADAVSGAWTGTWRSEANGHRGGLRAVATPLGDGTWRFRYRASWAKILCAGFTLDAAVKPAPGGTWTVSGSKNLGAAFGGTFTSHGTIRDGVFSARYEAKVDRGVMELRRHR